MNCIKYLLIFFCNHITLYKQNIIYDINNPINNDSQINKKAVSMNWKPLMVCGFLNSLMILPMMLMIMITSKLKITPQFSVFLTFLLLLLFNYYYLKKSFIECCIIIGISVIIFPFVLIIIALIIPNNPPMNREPIVNQNDENQGQNQNLLQQTNTIIQNNPQNQTLPNQLNNETLPNQPNNDIVANLIIQNQYQHLGLFANRNRNKLTIVGPNNELIEITLANTITNTNTNILSPTIETIQAINHNEYDILSSSINNNNYIQMYMLPMTNEKYSQLLNYHSNYLRIQNLTIDNQQAVYDIQQIIDEQQGGN